MSEVLFALYGQSRQKTPAVSSPVTLQTPFVQIHLALLFLRVTCYFISTSNLLRTPHFLPIERENQVNVAAASEILSL